MKAFIILLLVAALQSYTPAAISPTSLSVGFSEIVGSGESRGANIGIRNDSKKNLKNVVVMVKMTFTMNNKGKSEQGERTEPVEIKEIKAGATSTHLIKFHDKVLRVTSTSVESVLEKK